jgi:hypothetical protein
MDRASPDSPTPELSRACNKQAAGWVATTRPGAETLRGPPGDQVGLGLILIASGLIKTYDTLLDSSPAANSSRRGSKRALHVPLDGVG